MKEKFDSILNASKKRAAVVIACGVLTLTLGSGAVFAAKAANDYALQIKQENGRTSYSTDAGQTWTQGTPEGAVVSTDEKGGTLVTTGIPPKEGAGRGLMAKNVNGQTSYSIDGGKTWSENVPADFEVAKSDNGSLSIKGDAADGQSDDKKGTIMMKEENGVSSYSTDGQTWTQGTPDGAVITTTEDGGTLVTMGTPPKAGEGHGLMAKNVNGQMSYSTDGGKTWSENVPKDFEASVTADGSSSIKKK